MNEHTTNTSATTSLLNAIKADLFAHPINFRGLHNSVLDLIYQYYTEFISPESKESRAKHLEGAAAILKIMKERDEARGMETPETDQPKGYPYNKELEDILLLFTQEVAMIEKSSFSAGFAAGARLVFELMGEGAVGVEN